MLPFMVVVVAAAEVVCGLVVSHDAAVWLMCLSLQTPVQYIDGNLNLEIYKFTTQHTTHKSTSNISRNFPVQNTRIHTHRGTTAASVMEHNERQ